MIVIRRWMIYAFVVLVMILTVPDEKAHEKKVQEILNYQYPEAEMVQVSMNHPLDVTYHNLYVFTYTKYNRRVLTFGVLGLVFNAGGN